MAQPIHERKEEEEKRNADCMVSTQATTKTRIVYIWHRRPTKPGEGIVTVTSSVRSLFSPSRGLFRVEGWDRLDLEKKSGFIAC